MEDLAVKVEGAELAVSRSAGQRLQLIALHGSTPGTREGRLYHHLHEVLPPAGIGVVTFDRRGEGSSTGSPSLGNFELQARDCVGIMDALGESTFGVWGFSQGGWVAPLVAGRRSGVAFVITVGASGVTPHEQMRYGVARHLAEAGYDAAVARRVDELWVEALLALRGDPAVLERLPEKLRAASKEPWWPLAFLPEEIPDRAGREAVLQEMEFDPLPAFRAVRCPVLAIYGAHDEWVPVDASVDAWRATQGGNVSIAVLESGRHDPLGGEVPVAEAYEQCLLSWLASVPEQTESE